MKRYPYLDLSVLAETRKLVVSRQAAIIFSENLAEVLWANGEGTLLLGEQQVSEALDNGLDDSSVLRRQVAASVSQLNKHHTIKATVRIRRGWENRLVTFSLSTISFPDGINAVLFVTAPLHGPSYTTAEMAQTAISCLDGAGHASAILSSGAEIIGATSSFDELGISGDILVSLVQEVGAETDRLIKRPIRIDDVQMAAGIARLSDDPALNLLILARAPIEEEPAIKPNTDSHQQNVTEPVAPGNLSRIISSRRPELIKGDGGRDINRWYLRKTSAEDEPSVSESKKHSKTSNKDMKDHLVPNSGSQVSKSEHNNGEAIDIDADGIKKFTFMETDRPVRFAWRMDRSGMFISVSPELERTVGPAAARITGVSWQNISNKFSFDDSGEIATMLEKTDTWSSKNILWPVQGTKLRVPVDLAGLPSHDKDRRFSGFHGFGTIHSNAPVNDPVETGLLLTGNTPDEDLDSSIDASSGAGRSEKTVLLAAANDDKIVNLGARRNALENKKLSLEEQANFATIGDKLAKVAIDNTNSSQTTTETKADDESVSRNYLPSAFAGSTSHKPSVVDTSILSKLPVAVVIFRDNTVLFVNQEFSELTGYLDVGGLSGSGGIEALLGSPDGAHEGHTHIVNSSGETIPVRARLQSVPWGDSRALLLALREHSQDQAEPRKKLQQDISEDNSLAVAGAESTLPSPGFHGISARELSGILDTATDGVVVLNKDGNIRSINRAAEALFGHDDVAVTGKHFTCLLAQESHRSANEYLAGLSENGVISLLNDGREMIGREAQGGLIPLFVTIGQLEESDGYCAVLRDITQWKKAEEDLVAAKRQAELANDQKTDFLAKISHEIRTPLNAIIGFSEVMLEERFGKISIDRYREYLRDINRSGSHVLELVNDLLDISKIEAGKLELEFGEVRLNEIVAEGVALTQPQANRNHIIIRTSLSSAVPTIVADPRSIRQIILNLVSNAIMYTKEGGQVIVSTVYEETGEVALRVRDTGIGMSENDIATALMPFRRVQTISSQHSEGTGLGLPLTKALVEANRARFSIESTPGEGTLVEIFFPPTRVLTE